MEFGDVVFVVLKFIGVFWGRQFFSVVDIDYDQWLEVQSIFMMFVNGIDLEKEGKGEEIVDQQVEFLLEKGKIYLICSVFIYIYFLKIGFVCSLLV